MTYGEKFIAGAKTPFKVTIGLLVILVIYYMTLSMPDQESGIQGAANMISDFFGLLILAALVSFGISITIFMGFLNAGGITHAVGFFVAMGLISRAVASGSVM